MLKLLIKFGDKVLCGLVLLMVLIQISGAFSDIKNDPKVVADVGQRIERANQLKPIANIVPIKENVLSAIEDERAWTFERQQQRSSVSFMHQSVDVNLLQKDYELKKKDHKCELMSSPLDDGTKMCIFPGCGESIAPPDVYLGRPRELKADDVSVMTVGLSWMGVSDLRDVTPSHCIVQRKVSGNVTAEWKTIVGEDGLPKKIMGRSEQEIASSDQGEMSSLPSGFQLPVGVSGVVKESPKDLVDLGDTSKKYKFLDYNLEPSTTYLYRVKAMGVSLRDGTEIEGQAWTEPLSITTKDDQGIGFVRYIPGLRDKQGQLRKKADGTYLSPDKAYVRISKLYTPPWSPVRYFIDYEHRNISVGEANENAIGKVIRNFPITTVDGTPVYLDYKKENFLYVSDQLTLEAMKKQLEIDKNWKPYRIEMDFTTQWLAKDVIEEVVEDKNVITKYNSKGEMENKEEIIKKYRYFLILEDVETKATMRLELERKEEDLTTRLLNY